MLRHLLSGEAEKTIARKPGLSRHTVHEYVKEIYRKLGFGSRAELIAAGLADTPYLGTLRIWNAGTRATT